MIHYKINILEELKKKGYSSTRIHKEHLLSDQTVQSIREGKNISLDDLKQDLYHAQSAARRSD